MHFLANDISLGVVVLLVLPMSLMAFGGPPLMYWRDLKPHSGGLGVPDGYNDHKAQPIFHNQDALETLQKSRGFPKRGSWFLKNVGAKHMGEEEKRSSLALALVTFPCVRKTAVCKNGGRGPKLTKMATGVLCACMCPYGYQKPNCVREWWA